MIKTKLVSLIACLILIGSINVSAKEVVIYVSGPWIYAQDPTTGADDRVVVFVPISKSHLYPQIFPGDYTQSNGKPALYQAFYKLDLPTGMSGSCTSKSYPYRLKENMTITIGDTVIQDEVVRHKNAARIAISLPKPACYISKSASESQVGTDPRALVKAEYTTLMELHYFVGDGPAHLSGTSDDKTVTVNDDLAFLSTAGSPPAISLVMMAVDAKSELQCDSYSHESLDFSRLSLALEGKLFALFPELKADGSGQNKGKYNSCPNAAIDRNNERMKAASEILENIQKLRLYVASPEKSASSESLRSLKAVEEGVHKIFGDDVPEVVKSEIKQAHDRIESNGVDSTSQILGKTDDIVWPFTVGGGDCHMAQISVNGVIPK